MELFYLKEGLTVQRKNGIYYLFDEQGKLVKRVFDSRAYHMKTGP